MSIFLWSLFYERFNAIILFLIDTTTLELILNWLIWKLRYRISDELTSYYIFNFSHELKLNVCIFYFLIKSITYVYWVPTIQTKLSLSTQLKSGFLGNCTGNFSQILPGRSFDYNYHLTSPICKTHIVCLVIRHAEFYVNLQNIEF